jgi:hypothetical protein
LDYFLSQVIGLLLGVSVSDAQQDQQSDPDGSYGFTRDLDTSALYALQDNSHEKWRRLNPYPAKIQYAIGIKVTQRWTRYARLRALR